MGIQSLDDMTNILQFRRIDLQSGGALGIPFNASFSKINTTVNSFIDGIVLEYNEEATIQVIDELLDLIRYLRVSLFDDNGKWDPPGKLNVFAWMKIGKQLINGIKTISNLLKSKSNSDD